MRGIFNDSRFFFVVGKMDFLRAHSAKNASFAHKIEWGEGNNTKGEMHIICSRGVTYTEKKLRQTTPYTHVFVCVCTSKFSSKSQKIDEHTFALILPPRWSYRKHSNQ